jgi:hypothetical protein
MAAPKLENHAALNSAQMVSSRFKKEKRWLLTQLSVGVVAAHFVAQPAHLSATKEP